MTALPLPLVRRLVPDHAGAVAEWWAGLSEADRLELLARWDRRANRCGHTRDEVDGEWHRLPVRVGVRFLPDADPRPDPPEWYPSYLQHLLEHDEVIVLGTPVVIRRFHICTAHPAARAVLAAGLIPADFACPLAAAECPMRRLLAEAPGRDARLTLLPAPEVADAR